MNYERLLEIARDKARHEAEAMWPASQPVERETHRRRLVVRYYLDFISPVTVDELF